MTTPWYQRIADGLTRSRENLQGHLNVLVGRGPDLDESFWEDLEEALVTSDMSASAALEVTERLRDTASRLALPDAEAVIGRLVDELESELTLSHEDFLSNRPVTVMVAGVNGTGKTTTVAKLAKEGRDAGRSVLLGSADTFRAAADAQLGVWADRTGVPMVSGSRGADPASVAFETMRRASDERPDLVLVDTAGRLHTQLDLMAELTKVKRVMERESPYPVKTLLVMDATTGQNGLAQARRFHEALGVDGIALTKLDGTAKGGIVVAIVKDMGIPVLRIGVGEGMDDLKPFDARDFAEALLGAPR